MTRYRRCVVLTTYLVGDAETPDQFAALADAFAEQLQVVGTEAIVEQGYIEVDTGNGWRTLPPPYLPKEPQL